MPRRSLFCARAPTGLVHWYQPRLGGAHLRPHVRTRRSTERGGGGTVVKARSWRCLGDTALSWIARATPLDPLPRERTELLF